MTVRAPEDANVVAARTAEVQTRVDCPGRSAFAIAILMGVMFGCPAGWWLGFQITERGTAANTQNWIPKINEIWSLTTKSATPKTVVQDAPTATLRGIKHQLLGNGITVTISLDKPAPYETHRLHDPERIVIDLRGTRLDPEAQKIIEVNQGGLLVIRIGQFKPDIARIVLDLAHQSDYSINAAADPPRLIIKLSKPELEDKPELADLER